MVFLSSHKGNGHHILGRGSTLPLLLLAPVANSKGPNQLPVEVTVSEGKKARHLGQSSAKYNFHYTMERVFYVLVDCKPSM